MPDSYHCPNCGGLVRRATAVDYEGSWREAARHAKPRIGSPEWRALQGDESQLERSERERSERQASVSQPPTAIGAEPVAEQLDRIAALRASGALTEAEFVEAKRRVLSIDASGSHHIRPPADPDPQAWAKRGGSGGR